jgi:cell division protein FtsB
MRIFAAVLALCLVLLQYRLWMSEQGIREVRRLNAAIAAQTAANREQSDRNRQLSAEVYNLKDGFTAIEERARSELGMVARTETFYQVVTKTTPGLAPEPPTTTVTARAQ